MESIDLNMNDIFEGGYESNEDIGHHDVEQNVNEREDGDNQVAEGDEVVSELKDVLKDSAKKRSSRVQVKLDVDRLKSSRGLPALPKLFEKVPLKGKGFEAHDLDVIMNQLEHWAHRLMPKMPFYEFVERMEKLGTKKDVQTCLKRIRLDLPFLDADLENNDIENEPTEQNDDVFQHSSKTVEVDDEMENIDSTLQENNNFSFTTHSNNNINNNNNNNKNGDNNADSNNILSQNLVSTLTNDMTPTTPTASMQNSSNSTSEISESAKERMERNRLQALQRRAMKIASGGGLAR